MVGNTEDRVSHNEAHLFPQLTRKGSETNKTIEEVIRVRSVGDRLTREGGKRNRPTSELQQESEGKMLLKSKKYAKIRNRSNQNQTPALKTKTMKSYADGV